MTVSLAKGQKISLAKPGGGSLTAVRMGLGWDPVKKKGVFGRLKTQSIDLDASALLFDGGRNLVDAVWFNQLTSKDGAVRHTGDNLTGDGAGDDESIIVDLTRLPRQVTQIVFTVNSFTGQDFSQVEADVVLARIPLAAPTDPRAGPTGDSVTVSWAASPAPGQLAYRIRRLATDPGTGEVAAAGIGRTTATRLEDAGAPGGALVSYEIVAVSASGRRSSPPITTAPVRVLRGLAALRIDVVVAPPDVRSATGQRVVLSWPPVPGFGEVVIKRTTDPDADAGPARRLQPSAPGECIDNDCRPGVSYHYRVYLAYHDDAGRTLPTEGRSATVVLTARPRGVTEIWANTDPAGVTTVSFRSPPDGQVRL